MCANPCLKDRSWKKLRGTRAYCRIRRRTLRARGRILDRFSDRIALTVMNAGSQGDERSTAGTIYFVSLR